MTTLHRDQIERFLRGNQAAIAGLLEQAYVEAGGHYAAMSPVQRQQQAAIDGEEYIAGMLAGTVDRASAQAVAHAAADAGIAVDDILRMSNALEQRVTAYITAQLPQQPNLAGELIRRARNIAASFRANLAAGRLDDALRRFPRPPS